MDQMIRLLTFVLPASSLDADFVLLDGGIGYRCPLLRLPQLDVNLVLLDDGISADSIPSVLLL